MDLSVVIPVKDEQQAIGALIDEVAAALDGIVSHEIICVDDGSADGTADAVRAKAAAGLPVRLIRHQRNYGQSAGVWTGCRAANAAWIATLDGDGQNDPADIPKLWQLRAEAGDREGMLMIAGHRRKRRDTLSKRLGSRFANAIRARMLGDRTPDTGCGLKLFPKALFDALPYFDHMHRFLPALVIRQGGQVRSVAVNHRPRQGGRSKYGNLQRLAVGIVDLLGVMWLKRRARLPIDSTEG